MNPLSAVYGKAIAIRNRFYDRGLLKTKRLQWPVVSIGNLRAGGAGKTPFTIHLGELLQERKIPFDVLSRGYKRASRGVLLVNEKGTAQQYGDEPLLIAKRLEVPVVVGEDRYAAGVFAEKSFSDLRPAHGSQWLHLLDDGFQHRRLARDFDIVLLTAGDANDSLLPGGRLREPLSSLQRADAVVLAEGLSLEALPEFVRKKYIWRVRRYVEVPADAPSRPIVFCGIARPESFYDDLERAGVRMMRAMQFSDHHVYAPPDIKALLDLKENNDADGFLTTEKDIINLASKGLLAELMPMSVARLVVRLADPQHALDQILGTIAERSGCRSE
jgi:tetraacyldisaccharide 4'-kinase